jgi:hypothetical protein
MSTWAAFAAKGAAAAATTAAGAGAAHAIAPAALDGFAAGTLLTGMCFVVVVAPRTMRKTRLSARRSLWSPALRTGKERPDYYAAPADTHSAVIAPERAGTGPAATGSGAPELAAPELSSPVLIGPALDAFFLAAPVADPVPAATAPAVVPVTAAQATAAGAPQPEAPLTDIPAPQLPLAFADPALEVFSPNAGQDYAGHAGADPYAPGVLDPVVYAPATPAAEEGPAFDTGSDDDIVLPGDDDGQETGRGYRSKHRISSQDSADRRSEAKRRQPRHAAPPTRFGSRRAGKLALFPLAPARG